jgi:hypothetical protein
MKRSWLSRWLFSISLRSAALAPAPFPSLASPPDAFLCTYNPIHININKTTQQTGWRYIDRSNLPTFTTQCPPPPPPPPPPSSSRCSPHSWAACACPSAGRSRWCSCRNCSSGPNGACRASTSPRRRRRWASAGRSGSAARRPGPVSGGRWRGLDTCVRHGLARPKCVGTWERGTTSRRVKTCMGQRWAGTTQMAQLWMTCGVVFIVMSDVAINEEEQRFTVTRDSPGPSALPAAC